MPEFIHGLDLCDLFFNEAIKPILDDEFPSLRYDSALIGYGSEVLGYDTPMSADHGWSPRGILFLREADYATYAEQLHERLRWRLPHTFRSYSVNVVDIPGEPAIWMKATESGPVNHFVWVKTVRQMVQENLNLDLDQPMSTVDWLRTPEQRFLEMTAGRVYHSGLGELDAMRQKYAYFPHDVWLYLLACQWRRISQEEAFVGRTGDVGDELGSQVIAARLVHDVMKLCFLMEKCYTPYPKWFGTAFSRLNCAPQLEPILRQALLADRWQQRENYLSAAYEIIAQMHNALGITEPLPTQVTKFHDRPYLVIHGDQFYEAIYSKIKDEEVKRLPKFIGGIDQYVNSTDVKSYSEIYPRFTAIYGDKQV